MKSIRQSAVIFITATVFMLTLSGGKNRPAAPHQGTDESYYLILTLDKTTIKLDENSDLPVSCLVTQSPASPDTVFAISGGTSEATFTMQWLNPVATGKTSLCARGEAGLTIMNDAGTKIYAGSYLKWTRKPDPGGCVDYGCCSSEGVCGLTFTLPTYTSRKGSLVEGSLEGTMYSETDTDGIGSCPNAKPHPFTARFRLRRY